MQLVDSSATKFKKIPLQKIREEFYYDNYSKKLRKYVVENKHSLVLTVEGPLENGYYILVSNNGTFHYLKQVEVTHVMCRVFPVSNQSKRIIKQLQEDSLTEKLNRLQKEERVKRLLPLYTPKQISNLTSIPLPTIKNYIAFLNLPISIQNKCNERNLSHNAAVLLNCMPVPRSIQAKLLEAFFVGEIKEKHIKPLYDMAIDLEFISFIDYRKWILIKQCISCVNQIPNIPQMLIQTEINRMIQENLNATLSFYTSEPDNNDLELPLV